MVSREAIDDQVTLGYEYSSDSAPPVIGANPRIRSGSIIYNDVVIGENLVTGHDVLIREETQIGDGVVVGTDTVIDGNSEIGAFVSMQTGVYIPSNTEIGDRVFLGPKSVLTNDRYPIRSESKLEGPILEDDVSIGANATIVPGVTVGERSFVAAGSVVTRDVPEETMAIGVPAEFKNLPPEIEGRNDL